MRCQSWSSSGKNGVLRQCTREAGHPVISEVIECKPYRNGVGEIKTSYTMLTEGHQWLRQGQAMRWPDPEEVK